MMAKSATRIIGILSIFASSACGLLGESDDNLWTMRATAEGVNDVLAGATTFGRWAVTRTDVPPDVGTLSIQFELAFVEPASDSIRLELALRSDQQSSEWTAVPVPVFVPFDIASDTARAAISVSEATCESYLDHLALKSS